MAATATAGTKIAVPKPCIAASHKTFKSSVVNFGRETKVESWTKLKSSSDISSAWSLLCQKLHSTPLKYQRASMKAMSAQGDKERVPGLPIDLRVVTHFIIWDVTVDFSHKQITDIK